MKKRNKSIPRKEKHGLKTRKGGSCEDRSMKGFHRGMAISTGAKLQSRGYFGEFEDVTKSSLWKSSWDQFDKRAQMFICLDILFPLSFFLIFTPPCMFEPYSLSWKNHYFLFFETLLEIHNWAFMHYCKRFRGQWKNS